MSKSLRLGSLVSAVLFALAAPAWAQGGGTPAISFSGAFGAALVVIGAGYGIGRIASAAVESMARQPEVAARIQQAMLVSAALIEGATFFALIVCIVSGG